MKQNVVGGAVLAVVAALVVALGQVLGLDLQHVALVGAALGAVIGLVPDRTPLARVIGLLAGVLAGWLGYALRAALLPDSASGRAVAALLVVVVCLAVCVATGTRVPLWSLLVGVAAVVASYEETYTSSPSTFVRESPTAATTVLLAAACGFLATAFLGPQVAASRSREHRAGDASPAPSAHPAGDAPLTEKAL
ncbi:hypothetical protein [Angustibacter aerolatus]